MAAQEALTPAQTLAVMIHLRKSCWPARANHEGYRYIPIVPFSCRLRDATSATGGYEMHEAATRKVRREEEFSNSKQDLAPRCNSRQDGRIPAVDRRVAGGSNPA